MHITSQYAAHEVAAAVSNMAQQGSTVKQVTSAGEPEQQSCHDGSNQLHMSLPAVIQAD
jgi:hypothetical protein